MKLTVGTRGSLLARTQTDQVIDLLRARHPDLELSVRVIRTEGDMKHDRPLSEIGGKGAFVKELEAAMARGEIDLAVHSLKDLPALLPEGFRLAAILARGDARDAFVSRGEKTLMALRRGAVVATGSARRAVQIRALRPDLEIRPIRGNVDTRLRKLDEGEYEALVLAAAGLARLGRTDRVTEYLDPAEIIPAPGQGALAVETRSSAEHALQVQAVDDPATRSATTAERAFLAALGADCWLPVAAHAVAEDGRLCLRAMIAGDDGRVARHETTGSIDDPASLGTSVAAILMDRLGVVQERRRS